MGARVYKLTVFEGQAIPIVAYLRGLDGTVLTAATSGSPGVSSVDITVYERSNQVGQPDQQVYTVNVATASIMVAPVVTGSEWTDNPDGYNALYLLTGNDTLFVMEGGHVYLIEARFHMTGATGGKSWGDNVLAIEVTVLARYSQ